MSADLQFKQLIDRILRCREAEDAAKDDTKEVYAELKALGYDKTAAGAFVAELRKREKDPNKFNEASTVLDLYREAYERASGTRIAPRSHTHEISSRSAYSAASGGKPSIPRPEAGGAKMDEAATSPDRAAQAVHHSANSGQAATVPHSSALPTVQADNAGEVAASPSASPAPISAMTARTKADVMRLLRPHCQHPDDTELCAGQGTKHCVNCLKATAEAMA